MALFLASDPRYGPLIRYCVVENSFTNIPAIAKVIFSFRFVQMLPDFLFKNQFPNDLRVKKIEIPVLFLSGSQDALIPSWMMRSLHDVSDWLFLILMIYTLEVLIFDSLRLSC